MPWVEVCAEGAMSDGDVRFVTGDPAIALGFAERQTSPSRINARMLTHRCLKGL